MKRYKVAIIWLCLSLIGIGATSCISGGVGSADFNIGKFFSNPLIIIATVVLIIWMWSRKKK